MSDASMASQALSPSRKLNAQETKTNQVTNLSRAFEAKSIGPTGKDNQYKANTI